MTKKTKRYYPPEFKERALEMLATGSYSVSELERELGITPGLLGDWRRKAERKGRYAPTATTVDSAESTAEQICFGSDVTLSRKFVLAAHC